MNIVFIIGENGSGKKALTHSLKSLTGYRIISYYNLLISTKSVFGHTAPYNTRVNLCQHFITELAAFGYKGTLISLETDNENLFTPEESIEDFIFYLTYALGPRHRIYLVAVSSSEQKPGAGFVRTSKGIYAHGITTNLAAIQQTFNLPGLAKLAPKFKKQVFFADDGMSSVCRAQLLCTYFGFPVPSNCQVPEVIAFDETAIDISVSQSINGSIDSSHGLLDSIDSSQGLLDPVNSSQSLLDANSETESEDDSEYDSEYESEFKDPEEESNISQDIAESKRLPDTRAVNFIQSTDILNILESTDLNILEDLPKSETDEVEDHDNLLSPSNSSNSSNPDSSDILNILDNFDNLDDSDESEFDESLSDDIEYIGSDQDDLADTPVEEVKAISILPAEVSDWAASLAAEIYNEITDVDLNNITSEESKEDSLEESLEESLSNTSIISEIPDISTEIESPTKVSEPRPVPISWTINSELAMSLSDIAFDKSYATWTKRNCVTYACAVMLIERNLRRRYKKDHTQSVAVIYPKEVSEGAISSAKEVLKSYGFKFTDDSKSSKSSKSSKPGKSKKSSKKSSKTKSVALQTVSDIDSHTVLISYQGKFVKLKADIESFVPYADSIPKGDELEKLCACQY